MLHHAELKIFFEVLHMFEFMWIWNLIWIWNWKPYRKEIEKELENLEKRKNAKQPKPAQLSPARPRARAPAPPDRQAPPVSGDSLSRALSLVLAPCPLGPTCRRRFLHPRAPPLSASRARFASSWAVVPSTPFLSHCAVDLPVRSALPVPAVDRRVRIRARRRISRPRRPPTRPAPFLEPHQCLHSLPRLILHNIALSRALPSRKLKEK
jgi:hypothetical protein